MAAWFAAPKPIEELYDVENDPDEVHNLANEPMYTTKLKELREVFQKWTKKVGDMSSIPEREMVVTNWWGGKEKPPITDTPKIISKKKGVEVLYASSPYSGNSSKKKSTYIVAKKKDLVSC